VPLILSVIHAKFCKLGFNAKCRYSECHYDEWCGTRQNILREIGSYLKLPLLKTSEYFEIFWDNPPKEFYELSRKLDVLSLLGHAGPNVIKLFMSLIYEFS
jgi:hypothetical protein